jgi:hypothetical protein
MCVPKKKNCSDKTSTTMQNVNHAKLCKVQNDKPGQSLWGVVKCHKAQGCYCLRSYQLVGCLMPYFVQTYKGPMLLEPMKIPWLVFCNLLCQYYNVGEFVDKFGSYEHAAIFSKNTMPNGRRLVAYIQSWHSQLLLLLLATFWQQQQQPGVQKFQTWRLALGYHQ